MKAVEKTTWLHWTSYRRVVFHHRPLQYCKYSISHTMHALVGYTTASLYVQYAREICDMHLMHKLQGVVCSHKPSQDYEGARTDGSFHSDFSKACFLLKKNAIQNEQKWTQDLPLFLLKEQVQSFAQYWIDTTENLLIDTHHGIAISLISFIWRPPLTYHNAPYFGIMYCKSY